MVDSYDFKELTEIERGMLTTVVDIFPSVGSTSTVGGVVQSPSHFGSVIKNN